jgi:ABC-type polysaccharide/polyol phosphate transport system ATPase subunit
MSSDIAISARNLSKCYHVYRRPGDRALDALFRWTKRRYEEFWALRDLSFDLRRGRVLGVIGRNGAGKSTLLQLLAGVLKPTSGQIRLNGKVAALLELGTGFVREYTGRENIWIYGGILGLSKQEIGHRLEDIISFADIGSFIDRPVKTYSSGMYLRLAFSIAVNVNPDILIVDEALAVGDMFFRNRSFNRMRMMREEGKTIVFVTHSMGQFREFCDEGILLEEGRVISRGSTSQVATHYVELTRRREDLLAQSGRLTRPEREYLATQIAKAIAETSKDLPPHGKHHSFAIGAGRFVDFAVYDHQGNRTFVLETMKPFRVELKLVMEEQTEKLAVGYWLHKEGGEPLYGHNTLFLGLDLSDIKVGEPYTVTFEQPLLLHPGLYCLGMGCADHLESHIRLIDTHYGVADVTVIGDRDKMYFSWVEGPTRMSVSDQAGNMIAALQHQPKLSLSAEEADAEVRPQQSQEAGSSDLVRTGSQEGTREREADG